MGGQGAFQHLPVPAGIDFLQKVFPDQGFEFRRRDADRVEVPAVRFFFRHRALQHLGRGGAPRVDADAVALFEIGA